MNFNLFNRTSASKGVLTDAGAKLMALGASGSTRSATRKTPERNVGPPQKTLFGSPWRSSLKPFS